MCPFLLQSSRNRIILGWTLSPVCRVHPHIRLICMWCSHWLAHPKKNKRKIWPMLFGGKSSVADPHRKNADADPRKNLNADPDADSCPYWTMASQVIVKEIFKGTVQREFSFVFWHIWIGLGLILRNSEKMYKPEAVLIQAYPDKTELNSRWTVPLK